MDLRKPMDYKKFHIKGGKNIFNLLYLSSYKIFIMLLYSIN